MFKGYSILNLYHIAVLLLLYLNHHSISALSCYQCSSTFPASSVCLPLCTQTSIPGRTCQLTRNVSLDDNVVGSLNAGHIGNEPVFAGAAEKHFVFGEEAAYLIPSPTVGWTWEYGPITYGCDTDGCNNPEDVNRLPNALNARIPTETLDRLLTGTIDLDCYQCDVCLDADVTNTDMSECTLTSCPSHSCNFVATRNSTSSVAQCGNNWHFTSTCIGSRETPQVDMTLIYYIRSKTSFLYQMNAICQSNNCNNFATFKQLKEAITIDPDLTCLINDTNVTPSSSSTTTRSSSSTTPTGSTEKTTLTTTIRPGSSTTTTRKIESTTSTGSKAKTSLINEKLFIFLFFSYFSLNN